MKDLNEYKAEIFSRSEKRIKRRRRLHRTVFSLCVPLFLTVIVLSAVMMQKKTLVETNDSLTVEDTVLTGGCESDQSLKDGDEIKKEKAIVSSSDGNTLSITNAECIKEINDTISELFSYNAPPAAAGSGAFPTVPKDQLSDNADGAENESEDVAVRYTVSLVLADGTKKKYVLRGTELSDADSGDTVIITEEKAEYLLSLLTNVK